MPEMADHAPLYRLHQAKIPHGCGFLQEAHKYLEDLYSGHKWHTTAGFFASLGYLMKSPEPLLKEAFRFVAVRFFGIEHFISLASTRNRRRTFNS